jgi:chemosensory pili system protein ChpB (putative protein-glutamate methylesterase)
MRRGGGGGGAGGGVKRGRDRAQADELSDLLAQIHNTTDSQDAFANFMGSYSSLAAGAPAPQPAAVSATRGSAASAAAPSAQPAAPKRKRDLLDRERRIASRSLVDDAEARISPAAPAPPASAPIAAPDFDLAALEMAPILDVHAADMHAVDVRFDDMHARDVHAIAPAPVDDEARCAVMIIAGIGGPDAVRQILTALPSGFPRAVLISQRLYGGRYDRLVQQLARASAVPVHLAEIGAAIVPGHVYIVPPDLGVDDTNGLRFVSATSEPGTLPVDDTAILLLSGADPAFVDVAIAHAMQGALVAGQSPEGCYDATAPAALRARGGTVGTPSELVQLLLARWPARASSP